MKPLLRWLAPLLVLAALAPAVLARDDSGSLEAYLRRMRASASASTRASSPRSRSSCALGQARTAGETKKLDGELEALGSEATPLPCPISIPA
jgi:hypothetical protein